MQSVKKRGRRKEKNSEFSVHKAEERGIDSQDSWDSHEILLRF